MRIVSFDYLEDIFGEHNSRTDIDPYNEPLYGVIVYSNDNWDKNYSELSRAYLTYSNQWGWDWNKIGHCLIGSCLDGTDQDVRLDYYCEWVADYCILLDKREEVEKVIALMTYEGE